MREASGSQTSYLCGLDGADLVACRPQPPGYIIAGSSLRAGPHMFRVRAVPDPSLPWTANAQAAFSWVQVIARIAWRRVTSPAASTSGTSTAAARPLVGVGRSGINGRLTRVGEPAAGAGSRSATPSSSEPKRCCATNSRAASRSVSWSLTCRARRRVPPSSSCRRRASVVRRGDFPLTPSRLARSGPWSFGCELLGLGAPALVPPVPPPLDRRPAAEETSDAVVDEDFPGVELPDRPLLVVVCPPVDETGKAEVSADGRQVEVVWADLSPQPLGLDAQPLQMTEEVLTGRARAWPFSGLLALAVEHASTVGARWGSTGPSRRMWRDGTTSAG